MSNVAETVKGNARFTPGPWAIFGPNVLGAWTIHTDERPNGYNQICQTDLKENALLIAASPDLFASCKELRDAAAAAFRAMASNAATWTRFLEECEKAGVKNGVGIRADAAIAKATSP